MVVGRVNRGLGDSTDSPPIREPIVVPEDADQRLELEGLRLHVQALELPHLIEEMVVFSCTLARYCSCPLLSLSVYSTD